MGEDRSFGVLRVAFREDLWISRVSVSIPSLSISSVVVSFWFILNLLQFLANVFQSVCAVW